MIFDSNNFEPIGVDGGKLYGVLDDDGGRRLVWMKASDVAENVDGDEIDV